MGLFTPKPKNTIDDKKWESIQRRANAEEARRGGMFSRESTDRRKANTRQRSRSAWS